MKRLRLRCKNTGRITYTILASILILGAFLRFYQLPQNPPGFFCDEACEGYNAYCISKNLRDAHGVKLPVFFRALGDWRGGAFIYLCIPAVKLFGLSEFSVRGTAAVIGILTIFLTYLLAKEIFNKNTGLLAALFMAICPWHFFFSRVGFQTIALPFFFTAALYFFFTAMNGKKVKTFLFISGMCFAISIYTYFQPRMFIPLFLIGLALIYVKKLFKMKKGAIIFIASVLIFSTPYMQFFFSKRDRLTKRFKQVSVFNKKRTPEGYARIISHIYFDTFSYRFLFKKGDYWDRSEVRNFGVLYKFQLPFIILGLIIFIWERKKPQQVLLLWLLLFPLPSALVGNRASVARNILAMPLFPLIAAYGTTCFFSFLKRVCYRPFPDFIKRKWSLKLSLSIIILVLQYIFVFVLRLVLFTLILAYIAFASYFSFQYFTAYFKDYPLYAGTSSSGWQYGPEEIFAYIKEVYDDYDEFSWQFGGPLINELRSLAKFYLYDGSYNKVNFRGFSSLDQNMKQLFITNPINLRAMGPGNYRVQKEFLAPDGKPLYLAVQIKNSPLPPLVWLRSPLYDNIEGEGFDKAYPPEIEELSSPRLWEKLRSPHYGFIPLRYKLKCNDRFKCIYLLLFVESPEEQSAQLRIGATDSLKVWLNSKLMFEKRDKHICKLDDYIIPVKLLAGTNTVLIKSCLFRSHRWDIFFRITDGEGNNIDNLTYKITQ